MLKGCLDCKRETQPGLPPHRQNADRGRLASELRVCASRACVQLKAVLPSQEGGRAAPGRFWSTPLFGMCSFLLDPQLHPSTSPLGRDLVTALRDPSLQQGDRCSDGLDPLAVRGAGQPCPDRMPRGGSGLGEDN